MISKTEILDFLNYLHEKEQISTAICPIKIHEKVFPDIINAVKNSNDITLMYQSIGKILSTTSSDYKSIYYREDLYDYLLQLGYDKIDAYDLSEFIRKGKLSFKDYPHFEITDLDLIKWAKGVLYLPSRMLIFDLFDKDYSDYKHNSASL